MMKNLTLSMSRTLCKTKKRSILPGGNGFRLSWYLQHNKFTFVSSEIVYCHTNDFPWETSQHFSDRSDWWRMLASWTLDSNVLLNGFLLQVVFSSQSFSFKFLAFWLILTAFYLETADQVRLHANQNNFIQTWNSKFTKKLMITPTHYLDEKDFFQ